jgi:hypothetical protein
VLAGAFQCLPNRDSTAKSEVCGKNSSMLRINLKPESEVEEQGFIIHSMAVKNIRRAIRHNVRAFQAMIYKQMLFSDLQ